MECSANCQFWMNWFVQFAAAGFTLAAVLVALFGQGLFGRWFPPKLLLSLPDPQGSPTVATFELPGPVPQTLTVSARYYHLQVANGRRWSKATEVAVHLTHLEEVNVYGNVSVIWRGDVPLSWEHQHLYPVGRIVGTPARIDLCGVVKGQGLHIFPLVKALNLPFKWTSAVTLKLTLVARSGEVDSRSLQATISWDGEWADGEAEMLQHLALKLVCST